MTAHDGAPDATTKEAAAAMAHMDGVPAPNEPSLFERRPRVGLLEAAAAASRFDHH